MNENVLHTCLHLSLLEKKLNYTKSHGSAFCCDFFILSAWAPGLLANGYCGGTKYNLLLPFALICFFDFYYFVTCYWSSFCMVWNVLHSSVCVWVCWNKNTEGKKREWGEENALETEALKPFSCFYFIISLHHIHLASLSVHLSQFVPCPPA